MPDEICRIMSLFRFVHRARPQRVHASATRAYATQPSGNPTLEVFNKRAKHLQKDRAGLDVEESRKVDYLKDEVAMRLCERLLASLQGNEKKEHEKEKDPANAVSGWMLAKNRISSEASPTSST